MRNDAQKSIFDAKPMQQTSRTVTVCTEAFIQSKARYDKER